MALKIAIILGSVREGRQGIKAAKFILKKLKEKGHEGTLIDPEEYDLPLLKKKYSNYEGKAPENLERLHDILEESEGYIVVSAEYNHSIPPGLSNIIDHFLEEYSNKPSGIVCYSAGGFGGVRAAMQLRAMLGEIGTVSIPSIFAIPKIQDSFDEEGNPQEEKLNKKADKFLNEFIWYAEALKEKKEKDETAY